MDNIKVSVVILNYNRREILKISLGKMLKQNFSAFEIIVCDNSSSDGSVEMIKKEFPSVKLIESGGNLGIKGYNMAIGESVGEIIVILDDDSFLEKDGLDKIVRKFDKYPKLGALGCKVINFHSNTVHHWHPNIKHDNAPEEGLPTPLFNGCAAAVRKKVLDEVGCYPEEFFIYENERDLCTRIIDAGYDVKYFTDITGYHMVSETGRSSKRLIFYSNRNRLWYYWKYLPFFLSCRYTFSLIKHNLIKAIKEREPEYLKSVFYAFFGMPVVLKKRKCVKKENLKKILY
ncbi:MAG: glycosyltransferase family 2 protein [Armatimonadota bacterium]